MSTCADLPPPPPPLLQNIIIMRETDFFTGTDSVYDLQGQWKFFAMGSFVNWAEI